MKFGVFAVTECEGAYLAHSVMAGDRRLKKGLKLRAEEIELLLRFNIETVTAAMLEEGDMHEDAAAKLVAEKLVGRGVSCGSAFTGRVNVLAVADGVAVFDVNKINALNAIDESITFATLGNYSMVTKGQLIATAKIIPLSVPSAAVEILSKTDLTDAVVVHPYKGKKCRLIQTELAAVKENTYRKSENVLAQRLHDFGAVYSGEERCAHNAAELASVLQGNESDVILIMGASAITDRRDVIPAAIEQVGGHIIHFGMPVDPGNLLLVAKVGDAWVLGLPGCARSPKLNGIDHILSRLFAGMNIRSADIAAMGVGGLLSEYVGRPQPRAGKRVQSAELPKVAVAVLAAGRSSRMGQKNKLLLPFGGATVLDHVLTEVKACGADSAYVITGHDEPAVRSVVEQHDLQTIHNTVYADGMSGSVKLAVECVPKDCDGLLIVLGDMPGLTREVLQQLIKAYNPIEGRTLIVPVHDGKRGNPVLWGKAYFPNFVTLEGDKGAKPLLAKYQQDIFELEVDSDAIFLDIDTVEAYRELVEKVE